MAQLELDRVLQGLTKDFQQYRTSFTQTMTSVQKTFVQAESTVKSIVASAGGAAWSTLQGSIQIVGMQLARFFIPTIISASKSLQDFADWLEDLSPETKKSVTQFAELAGAAAVTMGVLRLLGIKVDATTIAFGLLLIAVQAFAEWLDKKITELEGKNVKAAGQQFTHAEIAGTTEYQQYKAMSEDVRRKSIQEAINAQQKIANETILGHPDFDPFKHVGSKHETREAAYKQMALLQAIQQELVFGGKPVGSVPGYNPPGLGGGVGIGGLAQMFGLDTEIKKLFDGLKGSSGPAGARMGSGRGGFKFAFPTEMQPRFSPVEEARKQFQLMALKSPLEQELLRLQRQMAQEAIAEAPKRNKAYDVLANIKDMLGFR